jgi:hypothetical protein
MKEYIKKRVVASEMWSILLEDWLKIARAFSDKYGAVNQEYQELLSTR